MGERPVLSALRWDSSEFLVSISIRTLAHEGQWVAATVVRDASSLHRSLDQVMSEADRDPLTGLFTRRYF
ncbi:MAG TPA: hypothetical protein VLW45_06080 [Pelomicrobium sp.]|nr:hypothetical protein [Pelomicrobium sp.]